ncbi:MAG TPA: hypothetical protein VJ907_03855 [Halanaerobiales bacterium]|nr:hypothetical protein [Halanaerobiales bacterium]
MEKDPYNQRRFKILFTINYLEKLGCTANSHTVSRISGINKANVAKAVLRMADGEIIVKRDKLNLHSCSYKYKLSTKGKRILGGYKARYEAGYDLRLRRKNPIKVDYSDFELLPGLKENETTAQ